MSETEGKRPSDEGKPLAELQAFATRRGRPAVFLFLPRESLSLPHLVRLRTELGDRSFEEVDLVIHSGGGEINVAYQMVELIRLHADRLFACVPFYAKSAATLLLLISTKVTLDAQFIILFSKGLVRTLVSKWLLKFISCSHQSQESSDVGMKPLYNLVQSIALHP